MKKRKPSKPKAAPKRKRGRPREIFLKKGDRMDVLYIRLPRSLKKAHHEIAKFHGYTDNENIVAILTGFVKSLECDCDPHE